MTTSDLLATKAFWHYGRTVAYAASGQVAETENELKLLKSSYEQVPESRLIRNNTAKTVRISTSKRPVSVLQKVKIDITKAPV